ncbi:MAG: response regulator [Chitinophagaceae bacterium]|nr:response regulator [Chitinophagaceae bacterium]
MNSVLIIDDDMDFCYLMTSMLSSSILRVSSAHTLKEGWECLEQVMPSLILLDNNLPDGFGVDFMKKIRDFDKTIRVIMVSGDATPDIKSKALREGIHSFFTKPLRMDIIREQINSMIP